MELSIITINYNDLSGLKSTVQSVVNQTWRDFEYLVIDGASNDGSAEYIQSIEKELDYYVSESDTGVYNAMNKGILRSNGKYLMFLNSGDTFCTPNVLREIFQQNRSADVLYGGVVITDLKGNKLKRNLQKDKLLSPTFFLYDTIYHQSSFIKKSVFDEFGLYDEDYKVISDWILFLLLSIHNGTFEMLDINISNFDSGGISSTNPELILEEKLRELSKPKYGHLYYDFLAINRYKSFLKISKEYNIIKSNKILWLIIRGYLRIYYKKKQM